MAQTKTNQRWAEIDSVIKEHKAELKAAESHTVLRDFAKEHGFANKEDFFKFKHSLKKIGIFYDELRDAALQVWTEELADKAKELAGRENLVELHAWTAAVEADDGRAACGGPSHERLNMFFDWRPGEDAPLWASIWADDHLASHPEARVSMSGASEYKEDE